MGAKYKYLFGPVPSRRLGRSLGVDLLPLKTCTQNCIYCQLGKDAPQVLERGEYVPIGIIVDELKLIISEGLDADFITISGSGEPTLHAGLGKLIDEIRTITQIQVAIITNGTLLSRPDVRKDCGKADVVLPSLDAGSPEVFAKINFPHEGLDFYTFAEGLVQFRRQYKGQMWLEVFFCEGINTDEQSIQDLKQWIDKIRPDKVQVNTSVRPVVHPEAARVESDKLEEIARKLGSNAEVIADYHKETKSPTERPDSAAILETLKRRPCSLNDLCRGLGMHPMAVEKALAELRDAGQIDCQEKNGTFYFTAK
ncbi:MAG: radical SAM protein [Planctomycetaceae bacterium]|nr:radical SAM protein [Planctomycetaceae bacterium]